MRACSEPVFTATIKNTDPIEIGRITYGNSAKVSRRPHARRPPVLSKQYVSSHMPSSDGCDAQWYAKWCFGLIRDSPCAKVCFRTARAHAQRHSASSEADAQYTFPLTYISMSAAMAWNDSRAAAAAPLGFRISSHQCLRNCITMRHSLALPT